LVHRKRSENRQYLSRLLVMNILSPRRALTEVAVRVFKRIRVVAFAYITLTIVLISYSVYLRVTMNASPVIVFLATSPIFILGFIVMGIVYFGRKNELSGDIPEIAKLHAIFRNLIIKFGFVILLMAGLVVFATLFKR